MGLSLSPDVGGGELCKGVLRIATAKHHVATEGVVCFGDPLGSFFTSELSHGAYTMPCSGQF